MITLGVIVAGGQGRRLGLAVPKAMAPLLGITLLERAIATLAPACDAIAVAAPEDRPLALPEVRIECFRVADPAGASGPLAGVVAGLESRRYDRAMVLGVDFPLLRPAVVHALLERLGDRRAVFPAPGGVPQPLAAVYGAGGAAFLASALHSGERSISSAARGLDPLLLDDAELERLPGGLDGFLNLNTRADWERAEARLRGRESLEGAA